jgi:geranylgeranyl diphosphate synthase type II
MDDDDWRRGKPSCHKKYGEAVGVLTGDALLTYSFELLAQGNANGHSAVRLQVIREIAKAIGTQGMIGGQVVDVKPGERVTPKVVEWINSRKTGALISASVRVGALMGGANARAYKAIAVYGDKIGLVFQLVDDLLDKDGAVKIHGTDAVKRKAESLTRAAVRAVGPFGKRADALRALAEFILVRKF